MGFCCENLKERDRCKEQDVDGRLILKTIVKELDEMVWTGLIWLKLETSGSLKLQ